MKAIIVQYSLKHNDVIKSQDKALIANSSSTAKKNVSAHKQIFNIFFFFVKKREILKV